MQNRLFEFLKENQDIKLLLVKNEKEALKAADICRFLGFKPCILGDFRAISGDDLRSYSDELNHLLKALFDFHHNKNSILVSPFRSLVNPLPIKKLFSYKKLSFGEKIDLNSLKEELLYFGYSFVDIVEQKGEVSFRGDIFDIFPPYEEEPYRISLFDDEIDSIRVFNCENQKSIQNDLEEFIITPALFALNKQEYQKIEKRCENSISDSFFKDINSIGFWHLEELSMYYTKGYKSFFVNDLKDELNELKSFIKDDIDDIFSIPTIPPAKIYKEVEVVDFNSFIDFHKNKKITLFAKNQVVLKRVSISQESLKLVKLIEDDLVINIISKDELIISANKFQKKKLKIKKSNIILDDLKKGDLVVHENYGVGIFEGLENRRILGSTRDFIVIAYQGEDKLLLPVENLSVINRYIAGGGNEAIVDKLGKGSFSKLKEKVKEKLFLIAKEIVDIAAKRELIETKKINIKNKELLLFQKDAGFEYTTDQQKAIKEIFEDFDSNKPMDRLLSGDVGFGKTEVAMNAIFAVVKSGFKALFLTPTTLLSSQHFKTLNLRFSKFGIKIAKLDRFTSSKEKSYILSALKDGLIDICIGTHVLLGVEIKNLSLIIIDEEHKFGVKQKEKLKNLRDSLHILSMSATPIPRSLNLALTGVKGYSTLTTPPSQRKGVRTFVKEYDENLIKEIILRELRRGGQIFFIHNRIESIDSKKQDLLDILPNLKILILHSKISATKTEDEIIKFEDKQYDILLSTSIIESGIHIPNVNTIIVEGANNFGIADLHQLRGRVGRENREGFCYYLIEDKQKLSEESKKRLLALENNSFLGSGALLAYHDLEIRGGGNIVGEAQSGHIKSIGYNLYLKMLENSINELLNKTKIEEKEIDIKLSINAYLSDNLISEDRLRLELYRRLSRCKSVNEVYDIEEEIIDRFGKIDESSRQFLELIIIKILALQKNIKTITNYNQNITFIYQNNTKELVKSRSKDDDDLIKTVMQKLREN